MRLKPTEDVRPNKKQQELLKFLQKIAKGIKAAEERRLIPHDQVMKEVEEWLEE